MVPVSACARNLGVSFQSDMSMEQHVNQLLKSCFFQIRNISRIRYLLDTTTIKLMIQTLVTSRLDYSNALCFKISATLMSKLQKIQNAAARLISRTKRSDHISPVLQSLHWLPIKQRISFKILHLTNNCLYENNSCSY